MPTKISKGDFDSVDPRNGSPHRPHYGKTEVIGYCTEKPLTVLKRVYETHLVANYRGLVRPVILQERVNTSKWGNQYGLIIDNAPGDLPAGVSITGKLTDLDLDSTRASWGTTIRLQEFHEEALKYIIRMCFGHTGDTKRSPLAPEVYDSLEETIKNRIFDCQCKCRSNDGAARQYQEESELILEVATATLGLKKPTTASLDDFLFKKSVQTV